MRKKNIDRWLITGGCGFIGARLIKLLINEHPDIEICVLDNLSVGKIDALSRFCTVIEKSDLNMGFSTMWNSPHVTLVEGDIRDYSTCLQCCQHIDIVIHLAANTGVDRSVDDPIGDMETNVLGTLNMLEASRLNKVKRFVFASSGAPLGEVEPPIHEEIAAHPVSPYGASKLAGEGYCSVYYRTFGMETVVLRFGNVYGPGSEYKNSVVAKFIRNAIAGKPLEIFGDGKQTRDFIYIRDLAEALVFGATKRNIGGEIFQIASSVETTVGELVDQLLPILEIEGVENITVMNADKRKGDVVRNYSDTSKARKLLGWNPQTSLYRGLEQTAKWFTRAQHSLE